MEQQIRKKEEISLTELDTRIAEILSLKEQEDNKEAELKTLSEKRYALEQELANLCEILEVDKVQTATGCYTVSLKSGFKMPADDEAGAQLFQYMKDVGIYDTFITVNSQKLNSWANMEEQEAEKNGNFDFKIPGLTRGEQYKVFKTIRNKPKVKK